MTREELLKNVEEGVLPEGMRIENGQVYNALGINVTAIGAVIGELVKEYHLSIDVLKKFHAGFEHENDDLVNMFIDLGTLEGNIEKILSETLKGRAKWIKYGQSLRDLDVDLMYKLLLVYKVAKTIDLIDLYLEIFNSVSSSGDEE